MNTAQVEANTVWLRDLRDPAFIEAGGAGGGYAEHRPGLRDLRDPAFIEAAGDGTPHSPRQGLRDLRDPAFIEATAEANRVRAAEGCGIFAIPPSLRLAAETHEGTQPDARCGIFAIPPSLRPISPIVAAAIGYGCGIFAIPPSLRPICGSPTADVCLMLRDLRDPAFIEACRGRR